MNCIDAIEGVVKKIMIQFHQMFVEDRFDDTEYIRNIKSVIQAVEGYLAENQEVVSDLDTAKKVLYAYAKQLWLDNTSRIRTEEPVEATPQAMAAMAENDGYNEYYFDYIYNHDVYPR